MSDNNGDPFIATLYNVIFEPYLCDRLFSIIKLMNLIHLFIPQRVSHGVLRSKGENAVALSHSAQRKIAFWGEIKEMSKTKILPSRRKIALEILHQRFGHRSAR